MESGHLIASSPHPNMTCNFQYCQLSTLLFSSDPIALRFPAVFFFLEGGGVGEWVGKS